MNILANLQNLPFNEDSIDSFSLSRLGLIPPIELPLRGGGEALDTPQPLDFNQSAITLASVRAYRAEILKYIFYTQILKVFFNKKPHFFNFEMHKHFVNDYSTFAQGIRAPSLSAHDTTATDLDEARYTLDNDNTVFRFVNVFQSVFQLLATRFDFAAQKRQSATCARDYNSNR